MKAFRKGNDIDIRWNLFAGEVGDDVPYDLSGRKLSLYIRNMYGRMKVNHFEVDKNTIGFTFFGKDQRYCGAHTLELIENDGQKGMRTIDVYKAFEIVGCPCKDCDTTVECLDISSGIGVGVSFATALELFEMIAPIDFNTDFNTDFTSPLQL